MPLQAFSVLRPLYLLLPRSPSKTCPRSLVRQVLTSSSGDSPDTCAEVSSTTVFVTIPAAPSTVYVTLASNSKVPTTTVTRVETLHSTVSLFASGTDVIAAQSSISSDTIASGVSYDTTITQTSVVTLTQVNKCTFTDEKITNTQSRSPLPQLQKAPLSRSVRPLLPMDCLTSSWRMVRPTG